MFNLKIWWIVSVNAILMYSTITIATNINNHVDINNDSDCCSYREKKAINDKLIDNITTVADGVKLIADELPKTNIKERLTVERNAYPYVVARKGVDTKSISARKGVDYMTTEKTTEIIDTIKDERELNNNKNISDHDKSNNSGQLSIENSSTTQSNVEKNSTDNSLSNTTIKHLNTIKKKFRPKPTVTSVVGNDDDNSKRIIHGSPTKSPPLGMSTKINYVVPVSIVILVLPLFIVLMLYIYKNGRDCWEKRHYRRMDFLIDGMYNE